MGIFKKIKGEFIDIIEFLDKSHNTIVFRFERHDNEIKNNAKLIVREGQLAIFINEGQIADTFSPGSYTLNTQNLPILSTLQGWKYGFESPFKAEVYFISTRNFIDLKWGTKNPVILNDERFGMIEMRAFGIYAFKIANAALFIKEIVGTNQIFTVENIKEQLTSIIVTRFSDAVGESNLPVESFAANLNELSKLIFEYMQNDFSEYGINVTKFLIENMSMPEDVKKEIFELSRLDKIDLTKLTHIKTAKSLEAAATNSSGTAGAGVGIGAGIAMGNQMMQNINNTVSNNETKNTNHTPPPLSERIFYFIAVNKEQTGPFEKDDLKDLVKQKTLTKETFIWKKGMNEWQPAGNLNELEHLWATTPPPLPKS